MKTAGFSLIEIAVATAVVAVGVASLAQLLAVSARANRLASAASTTLLLSGEKMEELLGGPVPPPSPPGTLTANTAGYVDYLGADGVSVVATSVAVPAGTVYIRRWSITPLPDSPATAMVVQVLVTPWPDASGQTRLIGVRTRKAS